MFPQERKTDMANIDLPAAFEEFADARKAGFITMKNAKEGGKLVAGTFCAFTPHELLDAAGFYAVSLCGMSPETIPAAETQLPKNLCPLIKSSYGFYLTDKCPYTYFADLIVGETTCDGKKKMYEMLGEGKNVYILHLPQGVELAQAKQMWVAELKRFKKYLEDTFGVVITDDSLRKACETRNRLRTAKRELMELLAADVPPISGTELYTFLDGLGFKFDIEDAISRVNELKDGISAMKSDQVNPKGRRIMVTGCPIGGVFKKVVGAVQAAGANVVCFENCGGIKPVMSLIDTEADDIFEAMADHYLNIGCSVMTPNKRRMESLPPLFEKFRIDGVIDTDLQACHTYIIEGYTVKKVCREHGIPYMQLETDYSQSDAGQINTRISAFIETLE